uniref:WH2 domain-containing protein n=1 Tax=Parastrongyloides trichosuri TaxID=131310 RepID=A0A0N5A4H8_PARTI
MPNQKNPSAKKKENNAPAPPPPPPPPPPMPLNYKKSIKKVPEDLVEAPTLRGNPLSGEIVEQEKNKLTKQNGCCTLL